MHLLKTKMLSAILLFLGRRVQTGTAVRDLGSGTASSKLSNAPKSQAGRLNTAPRQLSSLI
jgi:hypothetical protein